MRVRGGPGGQDPQRPNITFARRHKYKACLFCSELLLIMEIMVVLIIGLCSHWKKILGFKITRHFYTYKKVCQTLVISFSISY